MSSANIGGKQSGKEFLRIGDVRMPIHAAEHPELVPAGFAGSEQPPSSIIQSLKWILQKQTLGQDIFLIGTPGFLRSSIVLQFLELCNREFEYLNITRDTTEADIKQRREIQSGSAFYTDLCAVKAALEGRILLIDGVEKAERNVLPILNNLLENREMQLDDGRFLMAAEKFDRLLQKYSLQQLRDWKIERVSEYFSVIALGLPVPPFQGHSLDPPLRSRFQCRHIGPLPYAQMVQLCQWQAPTIAKERLERLLSIAYAVNETQNGRKDGEGEGGGRRAETSVDLPPFPTDNLIKASHIWNACPDLGEELILQLCYPSQMLRLDTQAPLLEKFKQNFGMGHASRMDMRVATVKQDEQENWAIVQITAEGKHLATIRVPSQLEKIHSRNSYDCADTGFVTSPSLDRLMTEMVLVHNISDFCLLGSRGTGKTAMVHEFAKKLGYSVETVILYQMSDVRSRKEVDGTDRLAFGRRNCANAHQHVYLVPLLFP